MFVYKFMPTELILILRNLNKIIYLKEKYLGYKGFFRNNIKTKGFYILFDEKISTSNDSIDELCKARDFITRIVKSIKNKVITNSNCLHDNHLCDNAKLQRIFC